MHRWLEIYTAHTAGLAEQNGKEIIWDFLSLDVMSQQRTIEFTDILEKEYIIRHYLRYLGMYVINAERHYKDNIKHGPHTTFYSDGLKSSESFYHHGLLHGTARRWWNNGQIAVEEHWEHGKKRGKICVWYKNGELKEVIDSVNVHSFFKE